MRISLLNMSSKVSDEDAQAVSRAVNAQLRDDFTPYWDMAATLRLEGRGDEVPSPDRTQHLRGDAVVYLWDDSTSDDAIGFHHENNEGVPFGFVFLDVAEKLGEPWTVTLSHEVIEIIADANVNKLAAGPHPTASDEWVLYWYELCDAVQAESYMVHGVAVSNFVLPLYFTLGEQVPGRNDFLGRRVDGEALSSFGVKRGGYMGYLNPKTNEHEIYVRPRDSTAERRLAVKKAAGLGRRAVRYENLERRVVEGSMI